MASKSRNRPRYAKIPVAAEYAGVCSKTIRRRISDGSLTGHRFGQRLILVDLDELDGLMRPIPSAGKAAS